MFFNNSPNYNFTSGNSNAILVKNGTASPFALSSVSQQIENFCLQVNFSGLAVGSAATVFILISNDGVNYVKVTGKEFTIAGAAQTSFFIFGDASIARAKFLQVGISGIASTGVVTKVILGAA